MESNKIAYEYTFTVFTPTYNRAYTLSRVYQSLLNQTYRDFEWLIVDDGSTDNTQKLIKKWQQEEKLTIRYVWQQNTGKPGAWNRGVQEARGELFLTFDSDDACLPEALERFKYHWDSIPQDKKEQFSGVTVLCKNQDGQVVGGLFPQDILDTTCYEVETKYKLNQEKWGFHTTAIMQQFPFPQIQSEKFISESIVWNRISRHYLTRFVNEQLRIYYQNHSDSISKNSVLIRAQNANSARLYYQEYSDLPISLFWKIRGLLNYIRFSHHAKISWLDIITDSLHKILTVLLLPVGWLIYRLDLRKFFPE